MEKLLYPIDHFRALRMSSGTDIIAYFVAYVQILYVHNGSFSIT